jgi:hypothetical protein
MAMTGALIGDFSSFQAAVDGSIVKLTTFEEGASKAGTSLDRVSNALSGVKIVQQAAIAAEAVDRIGGVSKLTEAELARVGATATEAAAKLVAMGQDVPPKIQALADAVKPVPAALKDVSAAVQPTTGFLSDLSGSIVRVAAGFVSAQAVIGVFTGAYHQLTDFVGESIHAFADAESADVKLVAALRQHSLATPEIIAQYRALGTTFQQTTVYSTGEIAAMEKLLTQVGGLMPSAMAGALKASTDLASGLGIDLQTATNLVAKAAAGHTETLGKFGITVSEADLKSKGFAAVLEAVNRQFGGQAAADLETYAGRVAQIGNSWNNLQEAVGKFIVQNPVAVAGLRALQDATEKGDKATADATTSWATFARFVGAGFLAGPIAALEAHAAALNDVARFSKQLNDVPSPFAKIVADAGVLPPITAGMKLFNEQLVIDAKATKDAAEAEAKLAAALDNLAAAGTGWQETVDAMDGSVVEAIKFGLSLGVSQGDLATIYHRSAGEIKAVSIALEEQASVMASTADFEKAAGDRRLEITRAMTTAINDQIVATLNKKQAETEASDKFLADALADAKAQDALNQVVGQLPPEIKKIPTALEASQAAFESFKGVVVAGTGEMVRNLAQVSDAGSFLQNRVNILDAQRLRGGFFVDTGETHGVGPIQTRDSGGPVTAGTSYLIGGGQAPELFTPGANGFVTPGGGGGGGVVIQNTFQIIDTEANLARRVSAHILRSVKQGQQLAAFGK